MKAADEWKCQRSCDDRVSYSSEIKALTTLPVTILVVSQPRFRNTHRALWQPRIVAPHCGNPASWQPRGVNLLCCSDSVLLLLLASMRCEPALRTCVLNAALCAVRCVAAEVTINASTTLVPETQLASQHAPKTKHVFFKTAAIPKR